MSKNLYPENDISFENSQTIQFDTPIPDACPLNYWMNEWLKKLGKE